MLGYLDDESSAATKSCEDVQLLLIMCFALLNHGFWKYTISQVSGAAVESNGHDSRLPALFGQTVGATSTSNMYLTPATT